MRYVEFKAVVRDQLRRAPEGLTWRELRDRGALPYERACPAWTKRLEDEIGLVRAKGAGRAFVWRLERTRS